MKLLMQSLTKRSEKMKKIDLNNLTSNSRETIILSQNQIFDNLKNEHDYWGLNSVIEMLDFCKRNQIYWLVKPLESLKKY